MAPAIRRSRLRWPSPAESDPADPPRFVSIALVRTRHSDALALREMKIIPGS
jgi:hypothetical protein